MRENVSHGEHEAAYMQGHERPTLASHASRTAAICAAYLLPHLRPGLSLLDVGCGPGSITLDLADAVAPGPVVGVENVEAPLAAARALASERGDARTVFQRGDVYALPFADGTFDVVHAHQVLQHLTDPVAALREMARVCRPGGLVAARDVDYATMTWYPELPGLTRWLDAYRAVARANGAEPDAGRRLRAWAREAGLVGASVGTSSWSYTDADACAWWGESQAARYSGEVFGRRAARLGIGADAIAEMAAAWRAWGVHPDAWFAGVHSELLYRTPAASESPPGMAGEG